MVKIVVASNASFWGIVIGVFIIGIIIGAAATYYTASKQTVTKTIPSTSVITQTVTKTTTITTAATTGVAHATKTVTITTTTSPTLTAPKEKVKLVVIGPWSGKEEKYFRAVIGNFTKKYPNIQIEYIVRRAEDIAKTMPLQFAAGKTPADVVITPWAWWIVKMAKKGYVLDISNLINPNEYISGIVDKVTYNGKIYGAPFAMWLKPGFWYRKSFFQKYGLKEPRTWSEFLELLNKIKKIPGIKAPIVTGDGVGWPESDIVEHFLITFGGPSLQLKLINCEVKFNDPQVKEIFKKYLVPLIKEHYFSEPIEWTQAIQLWWNGKYALYFMGTWITGMVPNPNDLDFFPLPGAKGVVGGADYAFIPKFTKHPEAAKLFVKFLATGGQAYYVAEPAGKIPTWKGVKISQIWKPMQTVYKKITERHMVILPDLDDSVGGSWQTLFWDQLKLLWAEPDKVDQILNTLTQQHPACKGK